MLRSFAGGRLFGGRSGNGPPAVLALHGWRRDHRDFDAVLGPFRGSPAGPDAGPTPAGDGATPAANGATPAGATGMVIDALAPDLPGFGGTPPPPEPWGSADYARFVGEVLDELAAEGGPDAPAGPLVVVGHSFGGRVALQLATSRPGLVRSLVLTGVPHLVEEQAPPRPPAASYRLLRRLRRMGLVSERRLEAARQRHGSPDYLAAQGVMRDVFVRVVRERYDRQLEAVRCATCLVWGERDTEAPLRIAEAAVERIADAKLVTLPDVGHLVPTEAPGALRRELVQRL